VRGEGVLHGLNAAPERQAGSLRWRSRENMAACSLEGIVRCVMALQATSADLRLNGRMPYYSRSDHWNRLSSMSAVNMKIAVSGDQQWRVVDLRQPNQGSVSKGSGNILVTLKQ
jgi:hypothetical protein